MTRHFMLIFFLLIATFAFGQADRWQQRAYYFMEIDFDVRKNQFDGTQQLVYQNNSPDTLHRVFYHLYFNAFQPGSMMDTRSRTIEDPDRKVASHISKLKDDEIGYQKIKSLKMNGLPVNYEVEGTVLEVELPMPILPHSSAVFDMVFEAQVPKQIRRSGRDNEEGIAYSMSQWYPKMAEYDYQGWHADPYIAREFYGVWGDFDVRISIDKDYILGGTGYLQNGNEVGYGYEEEGVKVKKHKSDKIEWHFLAPNVHDFVWAADPDYTHDVFRRDNGMKMHFLYHKNDKTEDAWSKLPGIMDVAFDKIGAIAGPYPYGQYSFIQAGDGGMEYPMATLITGERTLPSLVGVSIHELVHSWYQGMLGTNELLYAWMDEGFTEWVGAEVFNELIKDGLLPGEPKEQVHKGAYIGYRNFHESGRAEPMSMHADHFSTNYAYWLTAYTGGEVFLEQLGYIVGRAALLRGLLDYYWTWRFKHPNANDFIRIMEKQSGLELDWYRAYFINTTHTVDYGIDTVYGNTKETKIVLQKIGKFPMPLDILVLYENGTEEIINIPLVIMRGSKPQEDHSMPYTVAAADWPWTHPTYTLTIPKPFSKIKKIVIDPSSRLADIKPADNIWVAE